MRVLTLIAILFFGFSCKKDKLEDGKEIFIGKWNWVYSTHLYSFCDGAPNITETITPSSLGKTYSMEFIESGFVKYFENDNLLKKSRLNFTVFGTADDLGSYTTFSVYLDNKLHDIAYLLDGYIRPDTIRIHYGFPYEIINEECERYVSYFVKE